MPNTVHHPPHYAMTRVAFEAMLAKRHDKFHAVDHLDGLTLYYVSDDSSPTGDRHVASWHVVGWIVCDDADPCGDGLCPRCQG